MSSVFNFLLLTAIMSKVFLNFFYHNKSNSKLTSYKYFVSSVAGKDMMSSSSKYDSTYININIDLNDKKGKQQINRMS